MAWALGRIYRVRHLGGWALENGAKVALALLLAVLEPGARRVAWKWLRLCAERRATPVGLHALVEDLLKLGIAARIAARRSWPSVQERDIGIEVDKDPRGVILRTVRVEDVAAAPTSLGDPFEIAWWDHSSAGERLHVSMRPGHVIEVWIGDEDNAHRFRAIAALAQAGQ